LGRSLIAAPFLVTELGVAVVRSMEADSVGS